MIEIADLEGVGLLWEEALLATLNRTEARSGPFMG